MQDKDKEVSLARLNQVSKFYIKQQCDYLDRIRIDRMSQQQLLRLLDLTCLMTTSTQKDKNFQEMVINMAMARLEIYENERKRPDFYLRSLKKRKDVQSSRLRVSLWELYSNLVLDIEKPQEQILHQTNDSLRKSRTFIKLQRNGKLPSREEKQ